MAESKPTTAIPTAISVAILLGKMADFINDNDPTIQNSYDLIMNRLDRIQLMRAQLGQKFNEH